MSDFERVSLPDLIRLLAKTQAEIQELNDQLAPLKGLAETLQKNVIPERMDAEGIQNMHIAGVGRVKLTPQIQVATKQGMGPDLQDWMLEHGFEDLVVQTINSSTLKAWVKEQMAEGNEVPADYLNIYAYTMAVLTKS